jgi:hypothetical protein
MTGETDRLMTDSAQAELVYHVVTMASNLHERKRFHGANKMPYIDRVLVCARQTLTYHKFRTVTNLELYYLSSHEIIAFLVLVLFTRQKASSGEHGELRHQRPDTSHETITFS